MWYFTSVYCYVITNKTAWLLLCLKSSSFLMCATMSFWGNNLGCSYLLMLGGISLWSHLLARWAYCFACLSRTLRLWMNWLRWLLIWLCHCCYNVLFWGFQLHRAMWSAFVRRSLSLLYRNLPLLYRNLSLLYRNLSLLYRNLSLLYRNLSLLYRNLSLLYRNLSLLYKNLSLLYRNLSLLLLLLLLPPIITLACNTVARC